MPRDFKSFANEHKNIIDENKEKANEYENIFNKYKDMNQDELMTNLMQEATKLKQEGKLDENSLTSLKTTLSPFLNDTQKQMLENIINAIK